LRIRRISFEELEVSTLLEILLRLFASGKTIVFARFQPFLRFYRPRGFVPLDVLVVSTLLEILRENCRLDLASKRHMRVSTLLEILPGLRCTAKAVTAYTRCFNPS